MRLNRPLFFVSAFTLVSLAVGSSPIGSASAALLTLTKSAQKLDEVSLATAATATIDGAAVPLEFVSAGIRKKKVVVFNAKVYVAQLFVDSKSKFLKLPAGADVAKDQTSLNAIGTLSKVALRLEFLRELSAEKIVNSFDEALKANNLSPQSDPGLGKILDAVKRNGNVSSGDAISIVGINGTDKDRLLIENDRGVSATIEGDAKLVDHFFSIWFGVPADGGLRELKEDLTH